MIYVFVTAFGWNVPACPSHPLARREYEAHGLPYHDFSHSVEDLADACTVIRRLWTETEPFDFHGAHIDLAGAFGNPKPVQRPHPPILVAGRSAAVLRLAAEHADVWNIPGGDIADAAQRSALLDRYCSEIGRDPAAVIRSVPLPRQRRAVGRGRAHRQVAIAALPQRRARTPLDDQVS